MRTQRPVFCILATVLALTAAGCGYQRHYLQGEAIHVRARRVAVLPLVNRTEHPHAGQIVGDLLTTEIYAGTDFVVMEETRMREALRGEAPDLDEVLDRAVALEVGRRLDVDTVIFGSVTEFRYKRGLDEDPVVGVNLRLLDVPRDRILWAASRSGTGGCFWLCEDSLNRLAQRVCREMVTAMAEAR